MSCSGCRVLRKGCNENCILRPCLEWIESPAAQSNATLFLSKFYGRSDLLGFVAAVPENNRSVLFQSLLFEACGRMVNPVHGAVGLLSTGNWNVCTEAVATVLAGGVPKPFVAEEMTGIGLGGSGSGTRQATSSYMPDNFMHGMNNDNNNNNNNIGNIVINEETINTTTTTTVSLGSGETEVSPAAVDDDQNGGNEDGENKEGKQLLNLFPEN